MTKVMVGIPTMGFSRNDHFYDYYNMLLKPELTPVMFARGQSPARNRNIIIRKALELECTHVFFLDDDIAIPHDALMKLLANSHLDVVTGLYLMRNFPHNPIIFDEAYNDGKCKHHFLENDEHNTLIPIVNCGLGCVLIKIEVFKTLEEPWIRLGETESDHWGDDVGFFNRVREAGFKLFCDLSITAGHMCQVEVRPVYQNGKWYTLYNTHGDGGALFPAVKPSKEQIDEERQRALAGA